MQVVVLMGGLGTRLREYTKTCPKPLVDINGKPFFSYQLEIMKIAGFRKYVFCLGYRSEQIEEYFGNGSEFGVEIQYSYDGEELLGTGGAVCKALPYLEEDFLLIYGDSFMDINFFEVLVRYWQGCREGKTALMTIMRNNGRYDKSNVLCRDGKIILYDKRFPSAEMDYIDYGVSVFKRTLFENNISRKFDLSDLQNKLSLEGHLSCCETERRFYEIGNPDSLVEFRNYAENRWGKKREAIFLDRDGVINEIVWNEDIEQLDSPLNVQQFKLLPGVEQALLQLSQKGILIFVVTNQPAAAKGKTKYTSLCDINRQFVLSMKEKGIDIADVEMCPHFSIAGPLTKENYLIRECNCRKPKTGLIQRILSKYNIDINMSWMVGDSATDILCGKQAGLHTAFIGKYKCDLCMMSEGNKPDVIAEDLLSFVKGR